MKSFASSLCAAVLAGAALVSVSASFASDAPAPAAAAKPAKPDLAKGDAIFNATPANSQSCASCHSADGNSSIAANPKLAQQHPEYILKQLEDFKRRFDAFVATVRSPQGSRVTNVDSLFDAFLRENQQIARDFPTPGGLYRPSQPKPRSQP